MTRIIPLSSKGIWTSVIKRFKTRPRIAIFYEGLVQSVPAWATAVISILIDFMLWWIMALLLASHCRNMNSLEIFRQAVLYSSPVLCPGEASSGGLCSFLVSPVEVGWGLLERVQQRATGTSLL